MKKVVIAAKDKKSDQLSFLTVKEAAWYLRLCEKQVRRLISRGELLAYRFGTALRIKREDIDSYVEAQQLHPFNKTIRQEQNDDIT